MSKFKCIKYKEQIVSLFNQGKTYVEIANIISSPENPINPSHVRNMIRHELGNVKGNGKKVIQGYEEELLQMASSGMKPTEMARQLNISPVTVNSWFQTKHPEIKFLPDKGNIDYFHTIDSYAKAYIVGFIAADGSLVQNKGTNTITLTITLKYEDKDVLEFIKKELGNTKRLLEIRRPSSFDKTKIIHHIRFTLSDKHIAQDLQNLGITFNKSLTMGNIINNIPYEYRDAFIIGYFDGDGSVSVAPNINDNSLYIQIRGTKEFLSSICNHLNITASHIHQNDSIPRLTFANKKDTYRFFQCYNNLPFFYKRKYDRFLQKNQSSLL